MKKYDLFELTIVGIGVWAGYQAIIVALGLLASVTQFAMNNFNADGIASYFVKNLIQCAGYFIVAHFALRNTNDVVNWLKPGYNKNVEELGEEPGVSKEKPSVTKTDIMQMILVGVGMVLLLPAIPSFLETLYSVFQSRIDHDLGEVNAGLLGLEIIKVMFPLFLIIFSKKITSILNIQ